MKNDTQELAAIHAAATRLDIPYAQLRLSEAYQARSSHDRQHDAEILGLKSTIQAMGGLLQNLVVVAAPDGAYEVCAGGRRWTALGLLIEDGVLARDHPVPCLVIPAEYAHHASLIENIGRKTMHPADVFASYARLRAEGWAVDAIAAAHGASEKAVKKLLALGEVSPVLMDLFRQDKIALEEMQALAAVSDHGRQEAAWKAAKQGYYHRPSRIRELLAETELRGDSLVARYVTVAAYEKAGGNVRRDLFEDNTYLDDPEQVRAMAVQKMQRSKLAKAVAGEGWGWMEYRVELDYSDRKKLYGEIQQSNQEPTKAQAKLLNSLTKKIDDAEAKMRESAQAEDGDNALPEKLSANVASWRSQIADVRAELYDYPADLKPLAGAVLHLNYSGELTVTRGLIRQEDREAVAEKVRGAARQDGGAHPAVDLPPVKTRPIHSEALMNRLQAQRAIALQAEVIQRPNLALCLLIEQMVHELDDAGRRHNPVRCLSFSASNAQHDLERTDPAMRDCAAWELVQREWEACTRDVPGDRNAVLPWLLERAQADNIALLGALVSLTIYRVRDYSGSDARHLDRLAGVVGLNMAKWWTPTVESYLGCVSKDRIAAVVAEAVDDEHAKPLLGMKKGAAAAAAAQLLAGKGWVPELMRERAAKAADEA